MCDTGVSYEECELIRMALTQAHFGMESRLALREAREDCESGRLRKNLGRLTCYRPLPRKIRRSRRFRLMLGFVARPLTWSNPTLQLKSHLSEKLARPLLFLPEWWIVERTLAPTNPGRFIGRLVAAAFMIVFI